MHATLELARRIDRAEIDFCALATRGLAPDAAALERGGGLAVYSAPGSPVNKVLGLGLLWAYAYLPLPLYGTLTLIVLAYVTRFLPYAAETSGARFVQLDRSLAGKGEVDVVFTVDGKPANTVKVTLPASDRWSMSMMIAARAAPSIP